MPTSVLSAVRLMYAGAAFALIYGVGFIVIASAYLRNHPVMSARDNLAGLATGMVFLSLVQIGLWLGIARACRRGKSWARTIGTVLFGLYTLGTLGALGNSDPWIVGTKPLTVISWLIACAAVVFLWQPPSNAFFRGSR